MTLLTIKNTTHIAQQKPIINYYEVAGMDYAAWSKAFNMHFGYYRWGINPFHLEAMLQEMSEQVWKHLRVPSQQAAKLLDVGCGMGAVARYFAKKSPQLSVQAITLVEAQVNYGHQLIQKEGLQQQVTLEVQNFENMWFPSQHFDYAYAIESSCYARGEDKGQLIEEMYRVLQPGGRVVVCDGFRKHSEPLPALVGRIYRQLCKSWALPDLADVNHFVAKMKATGFKLIEVKEISWQVAPSVAYVPLVTLKFLAKQLWANKSLRLQAERWDNIISPLLTMFLGLCRAHFGYYLISAEK
ncbi:MAG: methyltransferase domain-containing protein [Thermonemataceae bacterium]